MRLPSLARSAFTAVVLLAIAQASSARATENYVRWTDGPGAFPLVDGENVAPICVDPNDWPGVTRAAADLRQDIKRVTCKEPANQKRGPHPIIIGTLGHSSLIDRLVKDSKLDISSIQGKWEAFTIQVVPYAIPDVENALVIDGSDKRGTIYDLSRQIGVSPSFWCDGRFKPFTDGPQLRRPRREMRFSSKNLPGVLFVPGLL